MANVVYLPEDPNQKALADAGQGFGKGFTDTLRKMEEEKKRVKDAEEVLAYTQKLVDVRRTTQDINEAYRLPPPSALLRDSEGLAKRFAIVNQVWNPQHIKEQKPEELVSYFAPKPGEDPSYAQSYTFAEEVPKGKGRARPELRTTGEIAALTKDKPEPRDKSGDYKPTDKDKLVEAEVRRAKLPQKQESRDRVRLYQESEPDIDRYLFSQAGTYNKDLNRFDISNPELYQKMLKVKGIVKEKMYKEGTDWSTAAQTAFEQVGVEPPKDMPPPVASPQKKSSGIMDLVDKLRGKKPAAAASTQKTATVQGEEVTLTQLNGQDIKLPKSIKKADEAHRYLKDKYNLSDDQALQILLRSHGRR